MIKIRQSSFETNSSSVHTLAWCRSYNKISSEDYEKSKTNIIDLYDRYWEGSFRLFSEKIKKLYTFVDDDKYDIITEFLEKYDNGDYCYDDISEAYIKNIEIDGIKFRDFYKELKKPLLEVIEELTGKKAEIINEEHFVHNSHDMGGFIPTEKEDIREVLLNKDIRIVYEDNFGCEEEDEYLAIGKDALKSEISKRKNKLEEEKRCKNINISNLTCSDPITCENLVYRDTPNYINNLSKEIYIIVDENLDVRNILHTKPTLEFLSYDLDIKEPHDLIDASKALYEGGKTFRINGIIHKIIKLEV